MYSRQLGKTWYRQHELAMFLCIAALDGVPCLHEAAFYVHNLKNGVVVKMTFQIEVPKGVMTCTMP